MNFKSLAARLSHIFGASRYVYTLVPKIALDAVLKEGLFSSEALLSRPDLMALSTQRNETVKQWQDKIKRDLKDDFRRPAMLGPSIFFHYPPDTVELSSKNPIKRWDLALLQIDLNKLMQDIPETKIFGMELTPYDESNPDAERHRYISDKEIDKFVNMSPEENWKDYADLANRGLYAPNVPHASVHVPEGIVPAKYLKQIEKPK